MLVLLAIGKIKNPAFRDLVDEYAGRLAHYVKFSFEVIPDSKESDPKRQVQNEGEKILKNLKSGDTVVLLDERGKQMSSVEFAAWLPKLSQKSKRVVFIIGGPFGFAPAVRERADALWGLSTLTLPHELARVFALEQLYRAHTILKGEKYHHQ